MRNKLFKLLALFAMASMLLAACGGGGVTTEEGPAVEAPATEAPAAGEKAKVVKVNVDNARNVAMNYSISAIPTVIIFKDGQVHKKFVGLTSLQDLRKAVDEAAG